MVLQSATVRSLSESAQQIPGPSEGDMTRAFGLDLWRAQIRRLLVAVSAFVLLVAASGIAQAGNLGDYTADGVNIRNGPGTSYTSLGLGYVGQQACVTSTSPASASMASAYGTGA